MTTPTTKDKIGHKNPVVWMGACELANSRHPNSKYPQPKDYADAMAIIAARKHGVSDRTIKRWKKNTIPAIYAMLGQALYQLDKHGIKNV